MGDKNTPGKITQSSEHKTKRKAMYEQISHKIFNLLKDKNLNAHAPVPSEGELAEMFGVSRMTTKLALQLLANEGIVYRLQRRGTFLSEEGQKILKNDNSSYELKRKQEKKETPASQNTLQIALVVPTLDDYIGRIVSSIENEIQSKGGNLIIKISESIEHEEVILKQLVEVHRINSIILFPKGRKKCGDRVLQLKLSKFPIVIIDRIFHEIDIDCVYHDHYQGAYDATQYLIDKGHRHIGFISDPLSNITSREERYQGYIQALLQNSIVIDIKQVCLEYDDDDLSKVRHVLKKYFSENKNLTAVFCSNDYLASQVMNFLLHQGIQIPDQISIIGFTDIQFSEFLPVPLTTMQQPAKKLGKSAVNLLLDRIKKPGGSALTIKLPTNLVERRSVKSLS